MPEFFELLVQSQEEYDKAITGQQAAKQTLDNIAAFQQNLLEEEGLIELAESAAGRAPGRARCGLRRSATG